MKKLILFRLLFLVVLLGSFLYGCNGPFSGTSGFNSGPPAENAEQKIENQNFDKFIATARFMPNDPRQMTDSDKAWFNQNAANNFNYTITADAAIGTLTADQINRAKAYVEACFQALNYVVYTKPFALATKAMFRDRSYYYDSKQGTPGPNGVPDVLPSPVGTILMLRGFGTDIFSDKKIKINFRKDSSLYYTADSIGSAVFNKAHDNYTDQDLMNNRRTTFLSSTESLSKAVVNLPAGANLEQLGPYSDIWMYTDDEAKTFVDNEKKPEQHQFVRGFIFDLFVHELFHSMFHWSHDSESGSGYSDLVYSYSGMIGLLVDARSELYTILQNPKPFPSTLFADAGMMAEIEQAYGGHLPMAYYGHKNRPSTFNGTFGYISGYASHSTVTSVIQSKLGIAIYQPNLPVGTLFLNHTTPFTSTSTKSVPTSYFSGLNFKATYQP